MLRRFAVPLLACIPISVIAAPVPKEDDVARMNRIYGTPCNFTESESWEMSGEKLRVFAGAQRSSIPNSNPDGSPRVWRDVKGDFTLTARVVFVGDSGRAAGLIAWNDANSYAEVLRHGNRGNSITFASQQPNGINASAATFKTVPTELFLRLHRAGKVITGEYSHDGKNWKRLGFDEVAWGDTIKVGLFVRSDANCEILFDEYKLTLPKK
jgi:regulation of enolase protein 1 (concanavalin A-like superfamily)